MQLRPFAPPSPFPSHLAMPIEAASPGFCAEHVGARELQSDVESLGKGFEDVSGARHPARGVGDVDHLGARAAPGIVSLQ